MKKSAERKGLTPIENDSATVVVDVANVMGARADGWWRDRAGAALRLCGEVTEVARRGDGPAAAWVLVLEGRARDAAEQLADTVLADTVLADPGVPVRVVSAPGSGDDAIVGVVAEVTGRAESCLVVTADRELRRRCEALGAEVAGPGWLLRLL
jgi:8-oxo-dGTP diphosphatase